MLHLYQHQHSRTYSPKLWFGSISGGWAMLIIALVSCRTHHPSFERVTAQPPKPTPALHHTAESVPTDRNPAAAHHNHNIASTEPSIIYTTHRFVIQRQPLEVLWYSGCEQEYSRTIQNEINNFAYLLIKNYPNSKLAFVSCRGSSWLTFRRSSPRISALNRQVSLDGSNIVHLAKQELATGGELADFFSHNSAKSIVMTVNSSNPKSASAFVALLQNKYTDLLSLRFFGLYHILLTDPAAIHPRYRTLASQLNGEFIALHNRPIAWQNYLLQQIAAAGLALTSTTNYPILEITTVKLNDTPISRAHISYRANEVKVQPDIVNVGDVIQLTYAIDRPSS